MQRPLEAAVGSNLVTLTAELTSGSIPAHGQGSAESGAVVGRTTFAERVVEHFVAFCPALAIVGIAAAQISLFAAGRGIPVEERNGFSRSMEPLTQQSELNEQNRVFTDFAVALPTANLADGVRTQESAGGDAGTFPEEPVHRVMCQFRTVVAAEELATDVDEAAIRAGGNGRRIGRQGVNGPLQEIKGPDVVGIEEGDEWQIAEVSHAEITGGGGGLMLLL